eukprot:739258-Rhodomonas_salina.1
MPHTHTQPAGEKGVEGERRRRRRRASHSAASSPPPCARARPDGEGEGEGEGEGGWEGACICLRVPPRLSQSPPLSSPSRLPRLSRCAVAPGGAHAAPHLRRA